MRANQFILLCFLSTLLFSCQKEENEVIQDPTQNLNKTSPLVNLLSRVSQNATSQDNVLDNSSCFSVQLPVTVIVNGENVVVATADDYQTVQDAIDAFSDDDDIVNFVYPITIQYQNFSTQVINNSDALDDVLDDCEEDDDDDFNEIDCVTINYPVVLNIYDSNNQLASTLTINNDAQFYNFIENLDDNEFIEINYPISIVDSNGNNVVISSNSQLEDIIEESIDDCDDNSGGGGGSADFSDVITNGTWYVSYFFEDDDNETSDYIGYNFTFSSNGTITVVKASATTNGSWTNYVDSGDDIMDLNFDDSNLDELEEDWEITEYSSTVVKLKNISGGDGETDYLYFTKN
jgi:hypothetical protein